MKDATAFGRLVVVGEPAEGFYHLRGLYSDAELDRQAELVRELRGLAPFAHPTMRNGTPLKVQVTSWGRWGWWADEQGYRYIDAHPVTKRRWPSIPDELRRWAFRAFYTALEVQRSSVRDWSHCDWGFPADGTFGYPAALDTCLVNLYSRDASLGWHEDKTETSPLPITTISLGEAALFEIELGRGVVSTMVQSGDVVIMAGPSRRARHRVAHILPPEQPSMFASHNPLKPGMRLSLTLRCTGRS